MYFREVSKDSIAIGLTFGDEGFSDANSKDSCTDFCRGIPLVGIFRQGIFRHGRNE